MCTIASVFVVCKKQLLFFQMKFHNFIAIGNESAEEDSDKKNRMQIQYVFYRYDDFTAIYGSSGSNEQKSLRSQMF